jgi:hypothetical protein
MENWKSLLPLVPEPVNPSSVEEGGDTIRESVIIVFRICRRLFFYQSLIVTKGWLVSFCSVS